MSLINKKLTDEQERAIQECANKIKNDCADIFLFYLTQMEANGRPLDYGMTAALNSSIEIFLHFAAGSAATMSNNGKKHFVQTVKQLINNALDDINNRAS
jgi:hypothetical protein